MQTLKVNDFDVEHPLTYCGSLIQVKGRVLRAPKAVMIDFSAFIFPEHMYKLLEIFGVENQAVSWRGNPVTWCCSHGGGPYLGGATRYVGVAAMAVSGCMNYFVHVYAGARRVFFYVSFTYRGDV